MANITKLLAFVFFVFIIFCDMLFLNLESYSTSMLDVLLHFWHICINNIEHVLKICIF
mgnify:CR=1 FL=1